jgi:hypothetical protein
MLIVVIAVVVIVQVIVQVDSNNSNSCNSSGSHDDGSNINRSGNRLSTKSTISAGVKIISYYTRLCAAAY